MGQFLTGDIWGEVNKLFGKRQKKIACIAYVTSEKLKLTRGDILICDASDYEIRFGATSAKTLDSYLKGGVKIFSNQQLHSKLLLTNSFLVIGSANLSTSSAERLTESSVVTTDDILISQAKAFCHNLIKESRLLGQEEINVLLKIKVVKRTFKPTTTSKTRQKQFGDGYWFVPVFPMKDRAYDKIKDKVEQTTKLISERENIDEYDISILKWNANTELSNNAKEGDQLILRFNNTSRTRSHLYPPLTILQKEVNNGYVCFYYDKSDSEKRKISWTKFQSAVKNLELKKSLSTRTKTVSKDDAEKLKNLWKKPFVN